MKCHGCGEQFNSDELNGYGYCATCVDCVDVVFLRESGDILAVFPGMATTANNPYHIACYASIGQHSSAGMAYCKGRPEVRDPEDYADLLDELGRRGYVVTVVRKVFMDCATYEYDRRKQLGL